MLRLALNRLSEDSSWDMDVLALEFSDILELEADIDLQISGFEIAEIDALLEGDDAEEEDEIPVLDENAKVVTRPADIWVLGSHRIICADARDPGSYERLLEEEKAQMVFADPPHHAIHGTGSGRALLRDTEFAVAAGEMSLREFENLLQVSLGQAAGHSTMSAPARGAVSDSMSGTTPAKTLRRAREASSRRIQPSSRSPWWPTRSATVRIGRGLSSIHSAAAVRASSRPREPAA
jgi:hypothetical protein